jgi:hypothetical protein
MRQSMPSNNIDSWAGGRPDEVALLQPLAEQAYALAVEPQQLDQTAAFATKGEHRAAERILVQHLLGQHR